MSREGLNQQEPKRPSPLGDVLGPFGAALFGHGYGAAALLDDEARLVETSPSFCQLLGRESSDLLGRSLSSFLQPSAKTLGEAALAGLQEGHGFEGDFPVLTADGSSIEAEWRFLARLGPGRHLALAQDVHAERQVQTLRRELEQVRHSAEDAIEAKDRLFSALSHELRTPLAPVLLIVSALESASDLPERFAPLLERIRRNLEVEVRLIDDLLARGTGSEFLRSVGKHNGHNGHNGRSPARQRALTEAPHLLLVEDHDDTAETLSFLLEDSGFRVTRASSVADALAAALEAHIDDAGGFDLVLSDLGLPDGNGCDLMRILAKQHGLKGVALSGYGMEEDVKRSLAAGFARHLTKPVDLRRLVEVIREEIG